VEYDQQSDQHAYPKTANNSGFPTEHEEIATHWGNLEVKPFFHRSFGSVG
jgi:hypothetical protein